MASYPHTHTGTAQGSGDRPGRSRPANPILRTQNLSNNPRFSWTETPIQAQQPHFEDQRASSPSTTIFDDSPVTASTAAAPMDFPTRQTQGTLPPVSQQEEMAAPVLEQQQVHPAHFAPYADHRQRSEQHQIPEPSSQILSYSHQLPESSSQSLAYPPPRQQQQQYYQPQYQQHQQHQQDQQHQQQHQQPPQPRPETSWPSAPPQAPASPLPTKDFKSPPTPRTPSYTPHSPFGPNAPTLPRQSTTNLAAHLPGQIAHPNSNTAPKFSSSLLAVDAPCLHGCFFPCGLYSLTSFRLSQKSAHKDPTNLLGHSTCSGNAWLYGLTCGLCGVLPCLLRGRVRRAYDIGGGVMGDYVRGCCCAPCVLGQGEREVRGREEKWRRNEGPSTGYVLEGGMRYEPPPVSGR